MCSLSCTSIRLNNRSLPLVLLPTFSGANQLLEPIVMSTNCETISGIEKYQFTFGSLLTFVGIKLKTDVLLHLFVPFFKRRRCLPKINTAISRMCYINISRHYHKPTLHDLNTAILINSLWITSLRLLEKVLQKKNEGSL